MRSRRRRTGRTGILTVVLGGLLLAVGVLVLLANPRHRAFYLGEPPASDGAPRPFPARPSFQLRIPRGVRPPPSAPPGPTVIGGRQIPRADRTGRVRVPVADRVPERLPAEGLPAGWDLKELTGRAGLELVRSDGRLAVRLRSDKSSFVLFRDVLVEPTQLPYLSWSWKVMQLPAAADVREPGRDDQAAQLYVVFPRWPSPRTRSEVIGYVWDTRAPVGTRLPSPTAGPNVRIIVVESGPARLGAWQTYERNLAQDYLAFFGRPAPRVGKVALMIDSDNTHTDAEALVGEVVFSPTPLRTEIPTSMLR